MAFDGGFACVVCEKGLREKDIAGHIRAVHLQYFPFLCFVCHSPFPSEKHLSVHAAQSEHFQEERRVIQDPQKARQLHELLQATRDTRVNPSAEAVDQAADQLVPSYESARHQSQLPNGTVDDRKQIPAHSVRQSSTPVNSVGGSSTDDRPSGNSVRQSSAQDIPPAYSVKHNSTPASPSVRETTICAWSRYGRSCGQEVVNTLNNISFRTHVKKHLMSSEASSKEKIEELVYECFLKNDSFQGCGRKRKLPANESSSDSLIGQSRNARAEAAAQVDEVLCGLCKKAVPTQKMKDHVYLHLKEEGYLPRFQCTFGDCVFGCSGQTGFRRHAVLSHNDQEIIQNPFKFVKDNTESLEASYTEYARKCFPVSPVQFNNENLN